MKPTLLVLGNAAHGKDTFAEILREQFGMLFMSSSQAAADIFIYDELKDKYGYKTPEECFNDRVNHRAEWYDLICGYNKDDKAKLAREIVDATGCYVGMRDRAEIKECIKQGIFDLIIWVDASQRVGPEPASSFNIDMSDADIIIDNNVTYQQLLEKTIRLGNVLFKEQPHIKDNSNVTVY